MEGFALLLPGLLGAIVGLALRSWIALAVEVGLLVAAAVVTLAWPWEADPNALISTQFVVMVLLLFVGGPALIGSALGTLVGRARSAR